MEGISALLPLQDLFLPLCQLSPSGMTGGKKKEEKKRLLTLNCNFVENRPGPFE